MKNYLITYTSIEKPIQIKIAIIQSDTMLHALCQFIDDYEDDYEDIISIVKFE